MALRWGQSIQQLLLPLARPLLDRKPDPDVWSEIDFVVDLESAYITEDVAGWPPWPSPNSDAITFRVAHSPGFLFDSISYSLRYSFPPRSVPG